MSANKAKFTLIFMSKIREVQPLFSNILARVESSQGITKSGLYIPENAREKSKLATVLAVGPEVKSVKIGDQIIFKEYAASEIKLEGEEALLVNELDVLAKI